MVCLYSQGTVVTTADYSNTSKSVNHLQRYLTSVVWWDVIAWKSINDVQLFFVLLCLELDLGTTWTKITAYVNISHLWQSTHVWPAGVMLTYAVDIGKTPRYPSAEGHLCLKGVSKPFLELLYNAFKTIQTWRC